MRVPVGSARISEDARRYVMRVLESAWLSQGGLTRRFEAMMAAAHEVRFATFCSSGTAALHAALAALREIDGWRDDDEVIVPAVTFVASANMVLANRLRPIFVDVDARTYNLDPARIDAAVTSRTRAIVAAHLFGLPCEMEDIMAVATRHGLRVVEDSCETMFVCSRGRPVGSTGDVACFSTRAGHLIATGIGGFVCTNDHHIAGLVRSLRCDGRSERALAASTEPNASARFEFERIGFNYRASELEAALGIAQMEERRPMLAARARNAALLTELLAESGDRVQVPSWPPHAEHAFAMYPIVLRTPRPPKAEVVASLAARGIESRDMLPLVCQPLYRRMFGDLEVALPVTRWINQCGFYVGCHEALDESDMRYVAATLQACLRI